MSRFALPHQLLGLLVFEVVALTVSETFPQNKFVTAAEADIDNSIKRKRIRVSLKKVFGSTYIDT